MQHDISTIQPLLDNILVETKETGNIEIDADRAYISSNEYIHKNKNVTVRTPARQKSIKQSTKEIKSNTDKMNIYKYKNIDKLETNRVQKKIKVFEDKIRGLADYITECKNNNKTKTMLGSKRYLIENYFCSLKHISKLYLRTDKLIKSFKSTIYIGFMYNYKIYQWWYKNIWDIYLEIYMGDFENFH